MNKLLSILKAVFTMNDSYASRRKMIEDYLSQSVDRVDLERRERELRKRGWV